MADHLTTLKERFGYSEFRPGQMDVLQALSEHGRALAVFPTGGGKSLCYQLPALTWDGITVVVSPLIALMKDQIDFLKNRGISAARMDSSLSAEEMASANKELDAGTLKLLYVAPERFNNERFIETIRRKKIALFAVDEAHCISEWGHNFRPDYLKLAAISKELKVERILALTATATPPVVEQICAGFGIPKEYAIVTGFCRPNLTLWTTPVLAQNRDALLLDRLKSRKPGSTIIYVTLQKTAERVAALLEDADYPARAYHAGMDSDDREQVQEWWKASDRNIVVATIAFGMGIDKSDVRYVYHYNLAKGLESYSQEIGRAGRDGQDSIVELFSCAEDVPTLENFAYGDTPTPGALGALVEHVMSQPEEFDFNLYELSTRYDIRLLVLRTALTYLELLGFLRQHTPFYSTYKIKTLLSVNEIVNKFNGERAQLIADIFAHAKEGRTWHTLDLGEVAGALKQERSRLVRAFEYLEQQGWVELQVADVRHRYSLIQRPQNSQKSKDLIATLVKRFERRERQEVRRVSQVLDLVVHDGCQTNFLVEYFGEVRPTPCGHCTWCKTKQPQRLPDPPPFRALPAGIDVAAFRSLRIHHAESLEDPRQSARFLCGLASPALTRSKLTRHELFGVFEKHRFADVLSWCEGL